MNRQVAWCAKFQSKLPASMIFSQNFKLFLGVLGVLAVQIRPIVAAILIHHAKSNDKK